MHKTNADFGTAIFEAQTALKELIDEVQRCHEDMRRAKNEIVTHIVATGLRLERTALVSRYRTGIRP